MVGDRGEGGRKAPSNFAPGVRVGENFENAVAGEDITAVAIAAPAAMHYSLAKAALEAGKDVFVEKPLCPSLSEANELVELADRVEQILMVGHLLQYHPCVLALRERLVRGDLGKLHYIISNR